MNDIQKFVNGVIKNHSMHKRYIAVLTALSMVVSIVVTSILVMPADSKAGSLICEKVEHIHNESCKKLVCGLDEGIYDVVTTEAVSQAIGQFVQLAQLEGEAVGDVEVAQTEASVEVAESSEVVEGTESIAEVTEETAESESAGEISEVTNEDTVPQVTESVQHIHTDECYMYVCGFEEHTHSEGCYESVEVDPTPDEVDSYMINQNAFDVFNVFGRPMHLLYEDVSAISEYSTENNPDSTMEVNPGAILGVATHFHVLAEEASFQSHVHGNVATNHLIQCGAFGVYLNKLAGKSSVNYIKKFDQYAPLDNAFQTKLVLGSGYSVTQEANRYKITDESGNQYYIPISNFPEGGSLETDIEVNENYINVTKELDKFADMSRAIAAKPSKGTVVNGDINNITDQVLITDNGGEQYVLDFSKVTDKYIYYTLDLTGNDNNGQPLINFSTCSKVLEIKGITEDKFLFLTVDVGSNENVAFNKSWKVYRSDDQSQVYGTGEVPLDDGSCRVIYNIVNSTTSNGVKTYTPFGENSEGQPTDSKIILGEQKNGTFLVPRGYVNCAGNTNGTIIAYKYVATGESHRADIQFEDEEVDDVDCPTTSENIADSEDEGGDNTTQEEKKISITVNKVWSDGIENGNHSGDNVTIQLYKGYEAKLDITNNDLINNGILSLVSGTNQITLNQGNNWTAKFENLPVKEKIDDQTEKLIYYYIKEVDVTGYTATYSANALNTVDRTVTVRNVKLMDLVIKKQWHKSNGTLITASDVDDNNNNILASMPSVQCTLYKSNIHLANNLPTDAEVVETFNIGASEWQYTKAQLPTEEAGKPLYYYVIETPVDGYNVSYENVGYLGSESITVKNTQKASGTISLTVYKNWLATDVSGVIDYTSPVKAANIEVTVELQKSTDGVNWSYADKATFTTSYTFTNLPKQENGIDIYYRVKELNVPYGYQDLYSKTSVKAQDVTDNGEATITVTNTLIKNSLTIKKDWYNDDSRGVSSIIVEVYRKLAGANNNPPISGTGESVPEDEPITPPSQEQPDDSSTVQGTIGADGVLTFPEKEIAQNDKICYDLSGYEGRMLKSVTIYSRPSDDADVNDQNSYNYSGLITVGTQNCNYQGTESSKPEGQTKEISGNLIVGRETSSGSGIIIKCLDVDSNCNITHVITKIEVEFYPGTYDISTGQKLSSFIRNNWLLFDNSPSDTVTYDETTKVLTVVPADGSFNYTGGGIDKAYRYVIPDTYKSKSVKEIDVELTSGLSHYAIEVIITNNDSNGTFSWNTYKTSGNILNSDLVNFSLATPYLIGTDYNSYGIYIRNYGVESTKVEKLEITFDGEGDDENQEDISNDTVTFKDNVLTVVPANAKGEDNKYNQNDGNYFKNAWGYQIPSEHRGKMITNIKVTFGSNVNGAEICILPNKDQDVTQAYWEGSTYNSSNGNNSSSFEWNNVSYTIPTTYTNYSLYVIKVGDVNSNTNFQDYTITELKITFASENVSENIISGSKDVYVDNLKNEEMTLNGSEQIYLVSWESDMADYKDKLLSEIQVTYNYLNGFPDYQTHTNLWLQGYDDSGSETGVGNIETSTNNNIAIWKFNNLKLSSLHNYFLRIATTQSQILSKIVIKFADGSEYTLWNKCCNVYDANNLNESADVDIYNKNYNSEGTYDNYSVISVSDKLNNYLNKYLDEVKVYLKDSNTDSNKVSVYMHQKYSWDTLSHISKTYDGGNAVITYNYGGISVHNLQDQFFRMQTEVNTEIQKVVLVFSDGSTFTMNNKAYVSDNTSGILNNSKDITLNSSSTDYQYGLLTKTEVNSYMDKKLSQIEIYFRNNVTVNNNQVDNVEMYLNKSDNGWITHTGAYNSGVKAVYQYNQDTLTNHNLSDDFFRIKTTRNTEIQKIVLNFTDNSTFTMNNKSYVASTVLSQSKEVKIEYDTEQYNLITKSDLADYSGKKITQIQTHYQSANYVSLDTITIYLRDTSGNQKGHNGNWTSNNIGYFNYSALSLDELNNDLLYLKTSVNDKIQKIVFTFDDGSTYTLINSSYSTIISLERDITINKSLYGDTLYENRGYWNDDNHEGFGFNNEHKNAYADKYFHSVQIYYRDMLLGFPDYQKDTKVYLLRSSEINGSWCPDQTGYGFDDNIATWHYGSESGEIASNLGEQFFNIKTSRPDEISKVVINFTDGSTYTMNNTAYVASSKVESSEDDYTYNTGEYVLIAKITITADGNWSYTLGNLPATDGQGNAYTYHIKETNIYGSDADKYKILSYTHENGIVLENDSNNIGVTNARNDDESIIVLPNTGSTGTKGYFIAGIIVMICGAAGYTVIKRRLIC